MSSKIGDNSGNIQDSNYNRAQTPKNEGDTIKIKDTFDKTGENDQGNLGLNTLKAAGIGAVVGLGLANTSEIKELKEKIRQLEGKQSGGKQSGLASEIKAGPGRIKEKISETGYLLKESVLKSSTLRKKVLPPVIGAGVTTWALYTGGLAAGGFIGGCVGMWLLLNEIEKICRGKG